MFYVLCTRVELLLSILTAQKRQGPIIGMLKLVNLTFLTENLEFEMQNLRLWFSWCTSHICFIGQEVQNRYQVLQNISKIFHGRGRKASGHDSWHCVFYEVIERLRFILVLQKYRSLMNFLSSVLREDGGFDYKKVIVDSILILIREIPEAKEPGLGHLCEFIEVIYTTSINFTLCITYFLTLQKDSSIFLCLLTLIWFLKLYKSWKSKAQKPSLSLGTTMEL